MFAKGKLKTEKLCAKRVHSFAKSPRAGKKQTKKKLWRPLLRKNSSFAVRENGKME